MHFCATFCSKLAILGNLFVCHDKFSTILASIVGYEFVPFENFKTGGRRIPGAHRSSGRDDRPSSSLFARQNAAPMMHGAATAADLDHGRGWLLEGASHSSRCGA